MSTTFTEGLLTVTRTTTVGGPADAAAYIDHLIGGCMKDCEFDAVQAALSDLEYPLDLAVALDVAAGVIAEIVRPVTWWGSGKGRVMHAMAVACALLEATEDPAGMGRAALRTEVTRLAEIIDRYIVNAPERTEP